MSVQLIAGPADGQTDLWLLAHAVGHWTCRRRDRSLVTGPCSWSLDLQKERQIPGYWPMQFVIGHTDGETDPWLLAYAVGHWTCRRRDR